MNFSFSLGAWTAWSSLCQSRDSWQAWALDPENLHNLTQVPSLSFVPPMTRRKFSPLTKAMATVAETLRPHCAPDTPSVFCSRHGEQSISQALLKSVAKEELLSPLRFSVSVHNTASGTYSIHSGNKAPSTAIAGGPTSFFKGLADASLRLSLGDSPHVMYVYGDEPPSELFQEVIPEPQYLYAIGLLLVRGDSPAGADFTMKMASSSSVNESSVGLAWLRDMWLGNRDALFPIENEEWRFRRTELDWTSLFLDPCE